MSNIRSQGNLDQGEGGAAKTKGNGSPTSVAKDVTKQGTTGSHLDQSKSGGALPPKSNGSNLEPSDWLVPGSDKTSVRGGGTPGGHDRISPTAGKGKSGSKDAQHPNVDAKNGGASGTYLGK